MNHAAVAPIKFLAEERFFMAVEDFTKYSPSVGAGQKQFVIPRPRHARRPLPAQGAWESILALVATGPLMESKSPANGPGDGAPDLRLDPNPLVT
jgi:hypothetical protein